MLDERLENVAERRNDKNIIARDKYIHQVKRCYSEKHRGGRDIWPGPAAIMETLLEECGRER